METNLSKFSSSNSEGTKTKYGNNFHEWIIYRTPSPQALGRVDDIIVNQDPMSITNLQFTSGTTGLPKAASLTHFNIMNNGIDISEIMGYSPEDRICLTVPFYHCFGTVIGTLACLSAGASMVLPSPIFNANRALEAIEKWKCTTVYGVPTMFIEMIKQQKQNNYAIESLYKSLIAGSICPKQLILDKEKYLGIENIHIAYGMTETSPVSFLMRQEDPFEKKCTSVGRIFPNVEAKIVSASGETVELGEKGEFAVKGYLVMPGYYNDPENTANSIRDGWMMSGDLGRMDEEGYLYIEGRIKDLIIRGGENISPKEIEEYIMSLTEVENVQVIGVPDPKYQEEICAVIKVKEGLTLTKEQVFDYLKPLISHFKLPKYVKFVDTFPITVTGKLQKFRMIDDWNQEVRTLTQDQLKDKYMVR
jgi:fatty-acyl-CoA synthase